MCCLLYKRVGRKIRTYIHICFYLNTVLIYETTTEWHNKGQGEKSYSPTSSESLSSPPKKKKKRKRKREREREKKAKTKKKNRKESSLYCDQHI